MERKRLFRPGRSEEKKQTEEEEKKEKKIPNGSTPVVRTNEGVPAAASAQ